MSDEYEDIGQYESYDEQKSTSTKIFNNKIIATLVVLTILVIGAFILFLVSRSDDDTTSGDTTGGDTTGDDTTGDDTTGGDTTSDDTTGDNDTGESKDTLVDPTYLPLRLSGSELTEMGEAVTCQPGWLMIIQGTFSSETLGVKDSYASITVSKFINNYGNMKLIDGSLYDVGFKYDGVYPDIFTMDCTYKCVESNTVLDFDPRFISMGTAGWLTSEANCPYPPTSSDRYLNNNDGDYYSYSDIDEACAADYDCDGYLDFSPGNPVGLILNWGTGVNPGCIDSILRARTYYNG